MEKFLKLMSATVALSLVAAGCTKKRDAALPEGDAPTIFAISEFGDVESQNTSSFKTLSDPNQLGFGQSAQAAAERGIVNVDTGSLNVPERLKYMFKGLGVQGSPDQNYRVVFAVDRFHVTAYKIVDDPAQLSILEKELATFAPQVKAEIALQRSSDSRKSEELRQQIRAFQASKMKALAAQQRSTYLVPIFKYAVESYGVIERKKNELREETSTLNLRTTDFSDATHIKISNDSAKRLLVWVTPGEQKDFEEIFVASRINNKIMRASQLRDQLGVGNNLNKDSLVLTLLDGERLVVYEIMKATDPRLSEAERQTLRTNGRDSRVLHCSDEIKAALEPSQREGCVLALQLAYPVQYKKPRMTEVSFDGSRSNELKFEDVRPSASVGLVRIPRNAAPTLASMDDESNDTRLRIADLKDKEFFFRRTAMESTATAPIGAGFGGPVLVVKFEFRENTMVVKRAEQIVSFHRDRRELDEEEIMSFPVKYFRLSRKDDVGNRLAIPRMKRAVRDDAEFVEINWTESKIPTVYSPFAFYAQASCFTSINSQIMKDLDLRLAKDGVLSFTIEYSATLSPTRGCFSLFQGAQSYDPNDTPVAFVQRTKERVSFMANDGRTDKTYVPAVPFHAQNAFNYGVFTTAKLTPTVNGGLGRQGNEENNAYVHDFRDGRTLKYVISGLPEADGRYIDVEGERLDLRELYIDVTKSVIADWNKALHRAFKGTALERKGDYVEAVVNGEGVKAELGDLDRNFIHYEETFNDSYPLGISQNGVNPRSGVSVSDFVVMYTGNFRANLENLRRRAKLVQEHSKRIAALREKMNAASQASTERSSSPTTANDSSPASPESMVNKVRSLIQGEVSTKTAQALNGLDLGVRSNILAEIAKIHSGKKALPLSQLPATKLAIGATDLTPVLGEKAYLQRILKKAIALDVSTRSDEDLELIAAREMLEVLGRNNQLSDLEQANLQKQIAVLETRKQMTHLSRMFPGCFFPARETLKENYANASYKEALTGFLKNTLAHEIGHSLGLTHNFAGNVDPVNFQFADESKETRSASTVMDYLVPEDDHMYEGPGPYDVHALRASYTGKVETNDGKLVEMDLIKKQLGNTWMSATATDIAQKLPTLKKFAYCTDKDVAWEPTCERHDSGRNALEIVQNTRADYEALYLSSYHGHDRLRFDASNASAATGRALRLMLKARGFLDEAIYQEITGEGTGPDAVALADARLAGKDINNQAVRSALPTVRDTYQKASVEAYRFLLDTILTPDASSDTRFTDYNDRLVGLSYEANGKKEMKILERRALQNTLSSNDRYDTLGVEIDKIFALQILGLKGLPHPKYARHSIALSFLDFERHFLGIENPQDSPVLAVMHNLLRNEMRPGFTVLNNENKVEIIQTPAGIDSNVTMSMRVYAAVTGVMGLEASVLRDKDNFANLFKVGSTKGAQPTDRPSVSPIGAPESSSQRMNYFAIDNAAISGSLVNQARRWAPYVNGVEPLKEKILLYVNALTLETRQKAVAEVARKEGKVDQAKKADETAQQAKSIAEAAKQEIRTMVKTRFSKEALVGDVEVPEGADVHATATDLSLQLMQKYASAEFQVLVYKVISIIERQSKGETVSDEEAGPVIEGLLKIKEEVQPIADTIPLIAFVQGTVREAALKVARANPGNSNALGAYVAINLTMASSTNFEVQYATMLNSLEFLHMLTRVNNPEYSQ